MKQPWRRTQTEASAGALRADREYARLSKLTEFGFVTQQSLNEAGTESFAARSRRSAAEAQLSVAKMELAQARAHEEKGILTAPISGVIAFQGGHVGDYAGGEGGDSAPLFRIVDNRLLNLMVRVPSSEMSRLRIGQQVQFSVDSFPYRVFSGTVRTINPEITATDRSVRVLAEIDNDPEVLKGGLFAKGTLIVNQRKGVMTLPRQALRVWDTATSKAEVLVIDGDRVKLRPIATGTSDGGRVEIVSGLKLKEKVVVRGGFNLKDGDPITLTGTEAPTS